MENGILTLWMADPYRNSAFNATTTAVNGVDANVYHDLAQTPARRTSDIRTNLLTDFNSVMNAITDTTARLQIDNAIVPAGDARITTPGGNTNTTRQDTDARTGNNGNMTNPQVPSDDRIWLPSWWEVTNNIPGTNTPDNYWRIAPGADPNLRLGQWQLNYDDAGYSGGGFSTTAWSRSGFATNSSSAGCIDTVGHRWWITVSNANAVRPAIHLSLSSLLLCGDCNQSPCTCKTIPVNTRAYLPIPAQTPSGTNFRYQWYTNHTPTTTGGTPIPKANKHVYVTPPLSAGIHYYYIEVTSAIDPPLPTRKVLFIVTVV